MGVGVGVWGVQEADKSVGGGEAGKGAGGGVGAVKAWLVRTGEPFR